MARLPPKERSVLMVSATIGILPSRSNSSSMIMTGQGSSPPDSCACSEAIRSEKKRRISGASGRIISDSTTR